MARRGGEGKGALTEERIDLLDSIGIVWEPHNEQWNKMFVSILPYTHIA